MKANTNLERAASHINATEIHLTDLRTAVFTKPRSGLATTWPCWLSYWNRFAINRPGL